MNTARPDLAPTAHQRVTLLLELGRHQDAEALAASMLKADPQDQRAWCLLSQTIMGQGDYERSAAAARSALAIDAESEWAYRLLSTCEQRMGHARVAADAAAVAVRLAPQTWQAHARLAEALAGLGGHEEEARATMQRALALAPDSPIAHVMAAKIERAARRYDEAARAIERALAIDPDNAGALNELGRLELCKKHAGSLAAAGAAFEQLARAHPSIPTGGQNLDATILAFLLRVTGITLTAAFAETQIIVRGIPDAALAGSVASGVLLLIYVGGYLRHTSTIVRRRLARLISRPSMLLAPVCLSSAAAVALLAAPLASSDAAPWLTTAAGVLAFGTGGLYARRRRTLGLPRPASLTARQARHALRSEALFGFLAFVALDGALATRAHLIGLVWTLLLAVACTVGAVAVRRLRLRTTAAANAITL